VILIDAATQQPPVFLPIDQLSYRVSGAARRPGDVVMTAAAVDRDLPTSVPVTYSLLYDNDASTWFEISPRSGVMRLTPKVAAVPGNASLVNVTVLASTTNSARDNLTSSRTLTFELIESGWSGSAAGNVCGLVWNCAGFQHATVTENSEADTWVATLSAQVPTARGQQPSALVTYHIVSGDAQNVFDVDKLTVSN